MIIGAIALGVLMGGCGSESEAKRIDGPRAEESVSRAAVSPGGKTDPAPAEANVPKHPTSEGTPPPAAPKLSKFYRVFKDGARIDPAGKPMLLVFGQPRDPYTEAFRKDVAENPELAKEIRADVTPIYVDARSEKRHKFMHNGQLMDVDTKTLVSIYHIDATPTMIFADKTGQSIFIVPGYMPPRQFLVTLRFVKEGVWKGKDRKNGEVYKALKAYYERHGIDVGKKEKK